MADPSPEAVAAALHAYWHAPPAVSEDDAMAGALRAAAATLPQEFGVALMADDPQRVEEAEFLRPHTEETARAKAARMHPAYKATALSRGVLPWEPLPDDEDRSTP